MSLIGPKEIYLDYSNEEYKSKADAICSDDSPETIAKFEELLKNKPSGEFAHGNLSHSNLLMRAVQKGNVTLVRYITQRMDPRILNLRDCNGATVLHHTVYKATTVENIMECAKILIEAGANVNARRDYCENGVVMPPLGIVELDEKLFIGESPLDNLIKRIVLSGYKQLAFATCDKLKAFAQLLVSCGAKCYLPLCQRGQWYLQSIESKVLDWKHTREFVNACNDQQSPLSNLPSDLANSIFKKMLVMSAESFS